MTKYFSAYLATFLILLHAAASFSDSAAIINSSACNYQFQYNSKTNNVEVKQVITTIYLSKNNQATINVAEIYNNKITLDDVQCRIDNHTPKNFKPVDEYYSSHDVFYSDARICYFPLLLPKTGSTASVTFKETVTDPRYFTSIYFPDDLPITTKEVTIKIPRWMKVELKEMNFGTFNIKKNKIYDPNTDTDIFTFTARDIPGMKQENNSPGPTYLYPHLLVLCKTAAVKGTTITFFNTLTDQYAWYRELIKSTSYEKEIINSKARDITSGSKTDMEKVKAIFYYVQNNIRYIAFENGLAGFRPENADEVLRKKYGDCKGMANLTKALLTSLGFDARLCWLGTNHIAYDYQTPSIAVDNHMICALKYKEKTIFLDATETYLGINEYAERIQGRQVLMENGNNYILSRIPVALPAQNNEVESGTLTINGNNLTGTVNHQWKGESKEYLLSGLNSAKIENTNAVLTRFLSDNNTNYAIRQLTVSNVKNIDDDFTVGYQVDYKNAVSSFSKEYYVDLDLKKEFLTSTIKTDERKSDYWFPYKMNTSKDIELIIPIGYKPANVPANLDIVNAGYEFHILYTILPGKLLYSKKILIKNTHLEISKFEQWNKDIEKIARTYNESVILKPIAE